MLYVYIITLKHLEQFQPSRNIHDLLCGKYSMGVRHLNLIFEICKNKTDNSAVFYNITFHTFTSFKPSKTSRIKSGNSASMMYT